MCFVRLLHGPVKFKGCCVLPKKFPAYLHRFIAEAIVDIPVFYLLDLDLLEGKKFDTSVCILYLFGVLTNFYY